MGGAGVSTEPHPAIERAIKCLRGAGYEVYHSDERGYWVIARSGTVPKAKQAIPRAYQGAGVPLLPSAAQRIRPPTNTKRRSKSS